MEMFLAKAFKMYDSSIFYSIDVKNIDLQIKNIKNMFFSVL